MARTNSTPEDSMDRANACNTFILAALQHGIRDPSYKFTFPPLLSSTWNHAVSKAKAVRFGLRIKGTEALQYSLFLAFLDVTDDLPSGSLACSASYELIQECLLHEDVLLELFSKAVHPEIEPVATEGAPAKSAFMALVGGLFEEAGNADKVQAWVFANFIPLIRIALRAQDEFGAGQPESPVKEAARCSPPRNGGDELDVLRRIHSYQLACKPAVDHVKSAVSNDDENEAQHGQDDHIVPNEEVSCTGAWAKCGFKNADPLEENHKTDLQAGSGHTLSHRDPQGPILSFPRASDLGPESLAISFRETLSL